MQLPVGVVVALLFVAGVLLSRIHFCMVAAEALVRRRFQIIRLGVADFVRLPYGMAMAAGAVLAMGGNDSQLLRFLPGGSPHGWLAVPAMVAGILIGLRRPLPMGRPRRFGSLSSPAGSAAGADRLS